MGRAEELAADGTAIGSAILASDAYPRTKRELVDELRPMRFKERKTSSASVSIEYVRAVKSGADAEDPEIVLATRSDGPVKYMYVLF